MPDKILDAFKVASKTGLFIDANDFKDQLKKNPNEVFDALSKDKNTSGLFLDYSDFENTLGLKKKDGGQTATKNSEATSLSQSQSPSENRYDFSSWEKSIGDVKDATSILDNISKQELSPKDVNVKTPTSQVNFFKQKKSDAEAIMNSAIDKHAPNIQQITNSLLDGDKWKEYISGDVVDIDKLLNVAKEQSNKHKGGNYVKEVIYNNLLNSVEYKKVEPEVNEKFNKIAKEQTGMNIDDYVQSVVKADPNNVKALNRLSSLQASFENNIKSYQSRSQKIVSEKSNDIFVSKYLPILEQKASEIGVTRDKNDPSKWIINFPAGTPEYITAEKQFNQLTKEGYDQYAHELRRIVSDENNRVRRVSSEYNRLLQAKASEINKNAKIPQDVLSKINGWYSQAYADVAGASKSRKQSIQDMQSAVFGSGFLSGKAFASSFLNSLASKGEGLVSMGMNNGFTDWLRGLSTEAQKLEVINKPLTGANILNPETYATRIGNMAGSSATSMLMGIPAAMLGGPIAGTIIGGLGGYADETLSLGGDTYKQAKADGYNELESQDKAKRVMAKNTALLPLYFLESLGMVKQLKGARGFLAGTAMDVTGEVLTEVPQQYFQNKERKGYDKDFAGYLKTEAKEVAIETAIGSFGQGGIMSLMGQASSSMGNSISGKEKQLFVEALQSKGFQFANALIETQFLNGVINKSELKSKKEELVKIANSLGTLEQLGLNNDQKKLYTGIQSEIQELKSQQAAAPDETIKSNFQEQIAAKEAEAKGILQDRDSYVRITMPNGIQYVVTTAKAELILNDESKNKIFSSGLVKMDFIGGGSAHLNNKYQDLVSNKISALEENQDTKTEDGNTENNLSIADELHKHIYGEADDISGIVSNVQKSLEGSGVKVEMIEDEAEFDKRVEEEGGQKGSDGIFNSKTGKILLNPKRLKDSKEAGRIIWHEGAHPVMNIIRNTNRTLYNNIVNGFKSAAKNNSALKEVKAFSEEYDGDETQMDEAIVETIARINDGGIDINSIPTGLKQNIIDFINIIAKAIGIGQILNDTDVETFKNITSQVAEVLKSGKNISEIVGSENVRKFENNIAQSRIKAEDILGTSERGDKKVIEVADAFEKDVDNVLDPSSNPDSRITRFLKNAYEDLRYFFSDYGGDTGLDWYTNKVNEFNVKLEEASDLAIKNGEMIQENTLRDKDNMDLFKAVLALSSIGVNPKVNVEAAFSIWKTFNRETLEFHKYQPGMVSLRTNISDGKGGYEAPSGEIIKETNKFLDLKQKNGKTVRINKSDLAVEFELTYKDSNGNDKVKTVRLVKKSPTSFVFRSGKSIIKMKSSEVLNLEETSDGIQGKGWTTKGNIVAINLDRIELLLNKTGSINAAVKWLNTQHPVLELREYNSGVPDTEGGKGKINPKGERIGSYIIGEKLGAFHQNVAGTPSELTMDLWWSRTWNRYMGTLLSTDSNGERVIQETPRTDTERNIMREAAKKASDSLGLEVHEFQAALWYLEQQMYKRMGAAVESYSFVDGINNVLLKYGKSNEELQPERYGIDSSEADQRRENAAARAANILYGEGSGGDQATDTESGKEEKLVDSSPLQSVKKTTGAQSRLAPNGKSSNLNEQQYNQVRTQEFKNWFGDWENDPANASKVVDENGEPLVVYHGSVSSDIEIFDRSLSKRKSSGLREMGVYFTTNKKLAEAYSEKATPKEGTENIDGKIYEAFLNIRKAKEFDAEGKHGIRAWDNLQVDAGYKIAQNRDAMDFLMNGKFGVEKVDGVIANNIVDLELYGYQDQQLKDKFNGTVYLVFDDNANAIKSATDNSGAFSNNDNRIQARKSSIEQSNSFKLASFVMRKQSEGASLSELVTGIHSVFPDMDPKDIKALTDNPEQWLRDKMPNLSEALQNNIIARAKNQNIYRARTRKGIKEVSTGTEITMEAVFESLKTIKSDNLKQSIKEWVRKYLTSSKGLPDWVLSIKDQAQGQKNLEVDTAARTVKELKRVAKSIGFTDWDAFAKAMTAKIEQNKRVISSSTEITQFEVLRAAEGKPFTLQDDVLPDLVPDEIKALPVELVPFVYKMRGQIDSLSKSLIGSGYVTPEQAMVLEDNIGQYVNRAYKMFTEKGYKPSKQLVAEAVKYIADQKLPQIAKQNAGIMSLEDMIKQSIEEAKKDVNAILSKNKNPYFQGNKVDARNTGILKEKKYIAEPIRKLMGEYTDPGIVFMLTVTKQAALKASSDYLSGLRELGLGSIFFEKNDENRPSEFSTEIASIGTDSKSPLGGLMTTPQIAEVLESMSPTFNELTNLWMKAVGAVRWGKTVGSIITQLKNIESNFGFAMMNGLYFTGKNGKSFGGALSYLKGQYSKDELSDVSKKVIRLGLVGQSVGANELSEMLSSGNIHDIALDMATNPKSKWKKVKDTATFIPEQANKAYRLGDDFWKVYAYLSEREILAKAIYSGEYDALSESEKNDIDLEASERVKNTWPSYDRVVEGAKYVSKRAPIIGNFISFQAESLRVLGNTIQLAVNDIKSDNTAMKEMGTRRMIGIASYIGFRTAATTAIAKISGIAGAGILGSLLSDDDEDRKKKGMNKALPPFMRVSDKLYIHNESEPWKYTVYDISSIDPYNVLPNTMNAITEGRDGIFNKTMEPGIIAGMTQFFGNFLGFEMTYETASSLFKNSNLKTGDPIVLPSDTYSEAMLKMGKYVFNQLEPSTISLVERLAEREDKGAELSAIAGARPYDVDLHKSFRYQISDMVKGLENINKQFNRVSYSTTASVEEKENAEYLAEESKSRLISNLNETYNQFIELGADIDVLNEIIKTTNSIKSTGFDARTKKAIKTGEFDSSKLYKLKK